MIIVKIDILAVFCRLTAQLSLKWR